MIGDLVIAVGARDDDRTARSGVHEGSMWTQLTVCKVAVFMPPESVVGPGKML